MNIAREETQFGRLYSPDIRDMSFPMQAPSVALVVERHWALGPITDQRDQPHCFPPDTPVLMADGTEKPISEIKAGDFVVSHTGHPRMVNQVMARRYTGPLTALKVRGLCTPLLSTPEHPYHVTTLQRIDQRVMANGEREGSVSFEAAVPTWMPAGEICAFERRDKVRHAVRLPTGRVTPSVLEGEVIDLWEYVGGHRLLSVDATTISRGGKVNIPRFIRATPQLARLIGLFLAEGCVRGGKGACTWSFHEDETNLHSEVAEALREIFGVEVYLSHRKGNKVMLVNAYSTVLGDLFVELAGEKAHGKRLHPALMGWEDSLLEGVWSGFEDGDGYTQVKGGKTSTRLVTVSPVLARQLWRIGMRLGYRPTITSTQPKLSHGVKSRRRRYDVYTYETGKRTWRPEEEDGTILAVVEQVTTEEFAGVVYNLEVEVDHTYIAAGAEVHNCVGHAFKQFLTAEPVPGKEGRNLPTPAQIYHAAQKIDEWPGPPPPYAGTSVRAGAKVLERLGLIYEYRWARDVEMLRNYVLTRGPVVVGTVWYGGMTDPKRVGGDFYLDPKGEFQGGHAYVLSGYDRKRHAFALVNSWGTRWADGGRAWVDFDVMDQLLFAMNGEAVSAMEVPAGAVAPRRSFLQRVKYFFFR
jgi:hypothetical protein